MSTTANATPLEVLHLEQFRQHIPGYDKMDPKTIEALAEMGGLQVSTLFELAIANVSGWLHESKLGQDLADGSDAKYITCRTHSTGSCYGARISNLHNKRGDIRVQVLCPKGDLNGVNQFFYFIIPYKEYKHIKTASGNLEIPFEKDGTPNRRSKNKSTGLNLWIYEVPDFIRMAHSTSDMEAQKRMPMSAKLFWENT
jgi:hypothetical protein